MGKRCPKEFREDVVRLARRGDLKYSQLAAPERLRGFILIVLLATGCATSGQPPAFSMIPEIPGLTAIADERPCAEDGCGVIREFRIDGIPTCQAATNITRIAWVEGVDGIEESEVSVFATESWCRRGELAGRVWIGELNGNTWQLRYTVHNTFRLSIIAP